MPSMYGCSALSCPAKAREWTLEREVASIAVLIRSETKLVLQLELILVVRSLILGN